MLNNKLNSEKYIWKEYWTGVRIPHLHHKNESIAIAVDLFLGFDRKIRKGRAECNEAKTVQRTVFRTRLGESPHLHHKKY